MGDPLGPMGDPLGPWETNLDPFLGPDPDGPKCYFLIKQKSPKPHLGLEMDFLPVRLIFWGPYRERFRRVSTNAFIFSLDDGNFCQFMNQNVL